MCIRSMEGVIDELRSDQLVDGVSLGNLIASGYDSDNEKFHGAADGITDLPGAGKGSTKDGSRNTLPEILTAAVGFSATGREWAAATTQGLQVSYYY
jgi:periodic tryptophan protein 2